MFIDTIRPICDKAHTEASGGISEALVSIDAIELAIEHIDRIAATFGGAQPAPRMFAVHDAHRIMQIAGTISCLNDRVRRDILETDSNLSTMIDAVMTDPVRPAGISTAKEVRTEDFAAAAHRVQSATTAVAIFDRDHMTPAEAAYSGGAMTSDEHQAVQDQFDQLINSQGDAILDLMRIEAPDLAGLHLKLALNAEHELHSWTGAADIAGLMAADAARLASANG